jgi:DNA primase
MAISDELVAEIRQRADIVGIIGQYIHLRKRGKNYIGLCPFHSEKTPSFNVSPELGIYKCFGCGKSGDVFTFLRDYAGMSFIEALRSVASQLGIPIPDDTPQASVAAEERRSLLAALAAARDFYRQQASQSSVAKQFFKERGLSDPIVEKFHIGYAPASWTALVGELTRRGFTLEQLTRAGLVVSREDGSAYDRFRDRIMFPISSIAGDVIAFGGRAIANEPDEPKYINSPQTTLYDKSATFYALHLAKHAIIRLHSAIVVEGYMDAIAMHTAGIEHCVATSGTALTERHLDVLRRFTEQLVLVFDGDAAGFDAAQRAVTVALRKGFSADVVLLPEGEDPDSIVRKRGEDALRRALDARLTPVEFLIAWSKQRFDWSNQRTATTQIRSIAEIVTAIPDPLYRELLLRELSDRVGIRIELLSWMAPPSNRTPSRPRQSVPLPQQTEPANLPPPPSPLYPEERAVLEAVLLSRTLAEVLFDQYMFDPASLSNDTVRRLLQAIQQFLSQDHSRNAPGSALPYLPLDDDARQLAEWIVFSHETPSQYWVQDEIENQTEHTLRHVLDDALMRIEDRNLEQRIAQLNKQLANEPDNFELLQQIDRLHKLRIQLRQRSS